MKTLTLLLTLITSITYAQTIGYPLQDDVMKDLNKTELSHCNTYSFTSEDSSVMYRVRKADNMVWDIDYTISHELVVKNGLKWITKHIQIGQNLFYDKAGTYYFILFNGTHYLIQVRNASIIRNKRNRKNSFRELIETDRVPVG